MFCFAQTGTIERDTDTYTTFGRITIVSRLQVYKLFDFEVQSFIFITEHTPCSYYLIETFILSSCTKLAFYGMFIVRVHRQLIRVSCLADYTCCELHELEKGEVVELLNGDGFYFITTECLLTVFIKHHDATSCQQQSPLVISPRIAPSTDEQLEQCLEFNAKMSKSSQQQIQPLRMANQFLLTYV